MATLALISLATGKVIPKEWAATGEVNMHGAVRKVEGLLAKLNAANSHPTIRKVLIPRANLSQVPDGRFDSIAIIDVQHFVEAYKLVFEQ